MCTKWIVMFDSEGLDTLVPLSDVREELIMSKLAGKEPDPRQNIQQIVSRTMMRAQMNPQRNPEVWAFNTAGDMDVDEMGELWINSPQYMADLIREKGDQLFGPKPGTKKSPVIV